MSLRVERPKIAGIEGFPGGKHRVLFKVDPGRLPDFDTGPYIQAVINGSFSVEVGLPDREIAIVAGVDDEGYWSYEVTVSGISYVEVYDALQLLAERLGEGALVGPNTITDVTQSELIKGLLGEMGGVACLPEVHEPQVAPPPRVELDGTPGGGGYRIVNWPSQTNA